MAYLEQWTDGDCVRIGARACRGVIKFIGSTDFAPGEWVGIELDKPIPNGGDGTVRGTRYFVAKLNHAIFARRNSVQSYEEAERARSQAAMLVSRTRVVKYNEKVKKLLVNSLETSKEGDFVKNGEETIAQKRSFEACGASEDKSDQEREVTQARQISVVIKNALTGDLVDEVSIPCTSTIKTVKEQLAYQERPSFLELLCGTEPLDEDSNLVDLPSVAGEPRLTLQMLRMPKRRVQLANARGSSSLGWLRFQVPVPGLGDHSGDWLGIEMDDLFGDLDGTRNGISYFVANRNVVYSLSQEMLDSSTMRQSYRKMSESGFAATLVGSVSEVTHILLLASG